MSESVEFSVIRRREDYFRAPLEYALRQPVFVLQFLGLPALAALLAFVIFRNGEPIIQGFGSLVAFGAAVALELWPVVRSFRIGSTAPGALEPITYKFDASGVQMQSAVGRSQAVWDVFTGASELKHYLILRSHPGNLHIIPKRDVAADSLNSFKAMLTANLRGKCQLSGGETSS